MSGINATQPIGMGVATLGDQRRHAAREHLGTRPAAEPAPDESGAFQQERAPRQNPEAPAEADGVPAATLFEATVLASRFLPPALRVDERRPAPKQEWLPPGSSLRLRDKLI